MTNWDDRSLAFLPWAHSYGQTCELNCGIALGASTGICAGAPGDSAELLGNIAAVKPTVLFSVPTLFKKLYDGVHAKIAAEQSPLKKFLMTHALSVGAQVQAHAAAGTHPGAWLSWQHKMLDKAVLTKMREPLGGNLRMAIVAGAPTPVTVVQFIESLGVSMTEGYGLTETSPALTTTYPDPRDKKTGTVGRVLPRTRIKLVSSETGEDVDAMSGAEGELWASGPQVMQGYWNKPEATAEVIVVDDEGTRWFRTGDLATLVEGAHVAITGRAKDLYKLENGKYVAPAPIEEALTLHRLVDNAVLYGNGKPHNVAVIVPAYAALAAELGLSDWYDPAELCANPKAADLMERLLPAAMEAHGIKKYEMPKKYLLVPEPFSAENEMLTPKLSVRKPNVIKAYKKQLDALY